MTSHPWTRFLATFVALVLLVLVFAPPLQAADAPDPVFAAWFHKYFSGLATRHRVVQVCAVAMCAALLILMKKFAAGEPRS